MFTDSPILTLFEDVSVGGKFPCFIVAEIGQNHQGCLNNAKKLIKIAKECGADCVKFQKSDLSEKFTLSALRRPYISPHSWGATYGEHKSHLEFSNDEFKELQKYAQEIGILFTASGMDPVSVNFLDSLNVPFIKIGSGDADNLLLIEQAAKLQRPLFISTGMLDLAGVSRLHATVTRYHRHLVLLHCVSAYPTPPEAVNLSLIQEYRRMFPDTVIGYSGHELGTAISVSAVALGAKVLERHITLDRSWKGSDHGCSLEPDQFRQLVGEVRQVELAIGTPIKQIQLCEEACRAKLGKSVVAAVDLPVGTTLSEQCLCVKVSTPRGLSGLSLSSLVGRTLSNNVSKDQPILYSDCRLQGILDKLYFVHSKLQTIKK